MKKAISLLLVLLLCLSLLTGCGSKTAQIDLSDYMNVLFRGQDGEGTARADFDFSGFEKAVMAATGSGDAILQKLVQLESGLKLTVTPDKGLKNGDTVTLTAVYDREAAKAAGIALSGTEKTVTVEGLTASAAPSPSAAPADGGAASSGNLTPENEPAETGTRELDPFDPAYWNSPEGIEVRYTGASPYGYLSTVSHLPEEDPLNRIYYRFSEQERVHEGDRITVTAYLTGSENDGYTLTQTEQEFTVGPLDHYLMRVDELDPDTVSALKGEAERLARDFAAGTLEFRNGEDWTGFYNGETVTVDTCEAGDTVCAVRCGDGYIQALLLPCYLHVTVEAPEFAEDPQTSEYDLALLFAADGIIVYKDGSVDRNRAELVQKGVRELEEELVRDQLTWYSDPTPETAKLPG